MASPAPRQRCPSRATGQAWPRIHPKAPGQQCGDGSCRAGGKKDLGASSPHRRCPSPAGGPWCPWRPLTWEAAAAPARHSASCRSHSRPSRLVSPGCGAQGVLRGRGARPCSATEWRDKGTLGPGRVPSLTLHTWGQPTPWEKHRADAQPALLSQGLRPLVWPPSRCAESPAALTCPSRSPIPGRAPSLLRKEQSTLEPRCCPREALGQGTQVGTVSTGQWTSGPPCLGARSPAASGRPIRALPAAPQEVEPRGPRQHSALRGRCLCIELGLHGQQRGLGWHQSREVQGAVCSRGSPHCSHVHIPNPTCGHQGVPGPTRTSGPVGTPGRGAVTPTIRKGVHKGLPCVGRGAVQQGW